MKSSGAHSTTAKPGKSLCEGPDIVCKKIGLTPTNIFHACIARNASGFPNICGGGSAVTIKELVSRIIVASGKSLSVQHDLSMPTIPTSLFLDCSKAQRELEWQPRYTLDQGIRKPSSGGDRILVQTPDRTGSYDAAELPAISVRSWHRRKLFLF